MVGADFVKTYALPLHLYKYRTFTPNSLNALESGKLYFASFQSMNDPMEGFFEQSRTAVERYGDAARSLHDRKLGLGICCLSEDRLIDLMWVHYAGNFDGFCLSYNLTQLGHALKGAAEAVRVSYAREMPTVFTRDLGDFDAAVRKVLSTKKDCWAYEKEWRLIAPTTGPRDVDAALDGIYVGPRADAANTERLRAIGKTKGVEVRRVVVDGYRLKSEPL